MAVHHKITASPIRPLDVSRDLSAVADLLDEAFQGELDLAGVRAVREMRLMGKWGGLLAWLDSQAFPNTGLGPGLVWIEDSQIVGHLSLRRDEYGFRRPHDVDNWLIGNVAVRKTYRRRGIARALMNKALEHIQQHGGGWVSLLVRASNYPAVQLYTNLGFHQTYTLAYWRHPGKEQRALAGKEKQAELPEGIKLRQARSDDTSALYDLAHANQPADAAWIDPVRRSDFVAGWDQRLVNWISGQRQICLVAESDRGIIGAVWADVPRPSGEGSLRVWIVSEYRDQLETSLVGAALDELAAPVAPLVCTFPGHQMQMYITLAQFGFVPTKILAHMRLRLN